MGNGWKKAGLVGLGAVLGLLLSLNFSAFADREARLPIPYEDLQLFSAVFGRIKSDYVEPVPDDKLIKEAINGMVHGLDPHRRVHRHPGRPATRRLASPQRRSTSAGSALTCSTAATALATCRRWT